MITFQQIPYTCNGLQYTGTNLKEVVEMFGIHPDFEKSTFEDYESFVGRNGLKIHTNWGDVKVHVGEYLLNGKYGLQVFNQNKLREHFIEIISTNKK